MRSSRGNICYFLLITLIEMLLVGFGENMSKKLLILGAGGHGRVVREVAMSIVENYTPKYNTIDFLDDAAENAIGKIDSLQDYIGIYDEVFCGIGNNSLRAQLIAEIERLGFEIPVLLHPTAYISPSALIGKGTIVEPGAIINANSIVGKGSIISVGAIVDHDVTVGKYTHINAGAICRAGSRIEDNKKIDAISNN